MAANRTLYHKAVKVSEDYLGPAGERFIRRQISTHLQIDPEKLDKKSLSKLIDWSVIAFSLITNSTNDIDAFTKDLKSLASNGG